MRSHPDTLELLILRLEARHRGPILNVAEAGTTAAFLRVAEELEPELSWSDDGERLAWLEAIETLRNTVHLFRASQPSQPSPVLPKQVLSMLTELAKKAWSGPRTESHRQLPFVLNTTLRRIAERDIAYLAVARKQEAVKMALVLAGCVVEAVLVDLLERWPPPGLSAAAIKVKQARQASNSRVWGGSFDPANPKKWTLAQMIGVSGSQGLAVLSERTEQIADVLREWRNFVHPREEAGEAPLQLRDATVAEALMESVLEEVEKAAVPTTP